jgi:hypothetical protein
MASSAASANQDAWKRSTNPLDHCDVVTRKTNTTDYMCKHCNHTFSGTKTRCYVHLTGDGTGVRQCSKCPAEVQRALKAAKAKDQGKGNLKRKAEEDVHEQRRSSHSEAGAGPSSAAATAGFDNTAVSIEACTASITLVACNILAASFTPLQDVAVAYMYTAAAAAAAAAAVPVDWQGIQAC